MVRGASASMLLLFTIIFYSNSQTKEYDCPDTNFCKEKSSFEKNRGVLECKLDYECGIHQKCCNNCEFNFKICTDIVVNEYLTNQDEYLKNKYCPKVNPCYTPLKYNPMYRCWSDESCTFGYKCCKSDCYIHKVCIVPIDKEGVEVVPPPTTTTSTTTEESISTIITTNRFPKTTLLLPTTKPEESSATVTKSPITMSPHQTTTVQETTIQTEISWPTITSRRTTVSTTDQATTKIQNSTEIDASGNGFTGDDDGGGDDGDDTGSGQYEKTETILPVTMSRYTTFSPTITTIPQKTSTASKGTTFVVTSGNEVTDDDDGSGDDGDDDGSGDDGDDAGSGHYEKTKTIPPVTISRYTTVSPTITTIPQNTSTASKGTTKVLTSGYEITDDDDGSGDDGDDDGSGDDGDDAGSGHYEKTKTIPPVTMSRYTTVSPTITTIPQNTSTASKGTTKVVTSGYEITDDDDGSGDDGDDDGSGDDGDDAGSGHYEKTKTIPPVTMSRYTTVAPTITTITASKGTTEVATSGNVVTDDDDGSGDDGDDAGSGHYEKTKTIPPITISRYTTVSPTMTTIPQNTSTASKGTTKVVTSGNEVTDDDDGSGDDGDDDASGDDEDDTGIGYYEKTKTIPPVTISRYTTVSPTMTTIPQNTSTASKGTTKVVTSGNEVTDDDDGSGDDGDDDGSDDDRDDAASDHYEKTKTIPSVTISRYTTVSPTMTTIPQKTSTASKGTTEVVTSANVVTDDDDGSGDDGDDNGSGHYEKTKTIPPVTVPRYTTVSPTITTIAQKTSTSRKGPTEVVGSGNVVTDDDVRVDDDDDDDGYDTGSGQHERTKTPRPNITSSHQSTASLSVTTIAQETSTKNQKSTAIGGSEVEFTDDNSNTGNGISTDHNKQTQSNRNSTQHITVSPTDSATHTNVNLNLTAANTTTAKATTAIPEGTQNITSFTRNIEDATDTTSKVTDVTISKNVENQTADLISSGDYPTVDDDGSEDDKSIEIEELTNSHLNSSLSTFITDFEFIKETTSVTKSQASQFPTTSGTRLTSTSITEEAVNGSGNGPANVKDISRETSQSTILAVTASKSSSAEEYISFKPTNRTISTSEEITSPATDLGFDDKEYVARTTNRILNNDAATTADKSKSASTTEQTQDKPAQPNNPATNLKSEINTPTPIDSVNESTDFKEEGSAYVSNDIDEDNDDDSDNDRDAVDEEIRNNFTNRI